MKTLCLLIASLLSMPALFGQNAALKSLAEEDQSVRLDPGKKATHWKDDDDRIKLVLELLAKGAAQTPEDKFNAAIVLQHTPLTFCENHLVSESTYNYLLAHYLARQSYEGGYAQAKELVAQSIDRYLSFTEGHQRYGTNRITNQVTGKEELVPIDRNVPDSERAKYGVPPLAQLLKAYPEQKPASNKSTAKPRNH